MVEDVGFVRDKNVVAVIDFRQTTVYPTDASPGQRPEHLVATDPRGRFHEVHIIAAGLVFFPVLGNLRPDLVSFLPSMRQYAVAADTAAAPTITRMCQWLGVSKSGQERSGVQLWTKETARPTTEPAIPMKASIRRVRDSRPLAAAPIVRRPEAMRLRIQMSGTAAMPLNTAENTRKWMGLTPIRLRHRPIIIAPAMTP